MNNYFNYLRFLVSRIFTTMSKIENITKEHLKHKSLLLTDFVIETDSGEFSLRNYQMASLNAFTFFIGFMERVWGCCDGHNKLSAEVISPDRESIGDNITGKNCLRCYVLPDTFKDMRFLIHGSSDGGFILVREDGSTSRIFRRVKNK